MGLLDRFINSEMKGMTPKEAAYRDAYEAEMQIQRFMSGGLGGQQPKPVALAPLPPTMEEKIMEYYLKPETPIDMTSLKGHQRYWVFTDNKAAKEVPTSNMNAGRQTKILEELTTAIDFDGCDNVDGLIQDNMIKIIAEVRTDKARSDFGDGIRERLVPSVGIGMAGTWSPKIDDGRGERPKESKAIFGAIGRT